MLTPFPPQGTFETSRATATGGTAFATLIRPYNEHNPRPNFGKKAPHFTHVTKVVYTTGATAHLVGIMRPFNFTTFAADAADSQAVVNIATDPGSYTTAWNYSPFGGTGVPVPSVANNLIAAGDYVVYEAADGTWILDTVSSLTVITAITMTTNLPTGGVKKGGLFYWFGVIGDTDPNTGFVNPQTQIASGQTRDASWTDASVGIVNSLHQGDPMIFYSPNTTNAGILEACCGYYAKF